MYRTKETFETPSTKTKEERKIEKELDAIIETRMRKMIIGKKPKKIRKEYVRPDMNLLRTKMRRIMEEEKQKKLSRRAIFLDDIRA